MTTYSRRWREVFGDVDAARTAEEVDFLARVLPRPAFASVLDVACGPGRHVRELAARGYRVTGVDDDPRVVEQARALGLDVREGDMRRLGALPGDFDGAICMWASFGFFDAATNDRVLGELARRLRPHGRLVLDVYQRTFFETHQGERDNRGVRDRKVVRDGRLYGELEYDDATRDVYEMQLFTPAELAAAAARHGFEQLLACTEFDERRPPAADKPRMQLVFARVRTHPPPLDSGRWQSSPAASRSWARARSVRR